MATEQELFVNEVPLQDCACATPAFVGRWEQLPASTAPARGGHSAVYLSRLSPRFPHSILVFGGANREGASFSDCHTFDLATRQWTLCTITGQSPKPRSGHTAALIDSSTVVIHGGQRIHIGSGGSEPTIELLSDAWRLDLASLTWQPVVTGKSLTRNCGVSGVIDGALHSMGGSDERGPTNTLHQLTDNLWQLVSVSGDERDNREMHAWCRNTHNDSWLMCGGRSELGVLNSIYAYHPADRRWQMLGQAPPRCGHSLQCIDSEHSFVFGGIDGLTFYNDVTVFEHGQGSVVACDRCHGPRGWHRLSGGSKTEGESDSSGSQSAPSLPPHRFAHTMTAVSQSSPAQFVLIGGMNDEADLPDVWLLTLQRQSD